MDNEFPPADDTPVMAHWRAEFHRAKKDYKRLRRYMLPVLPAVLILGPIQWMCDTVSNWINKISITLQRPFNDIEERVIEANRRFHRARRERDQEIYDADA